MDFKFTNMDLDRAKVYLNKINRLYDSLKESKTSISAIEKKLMLDYISNLYDSMLDEAPPVQARAKVYEPKRAQPVYTPPSPKREEPKLPPRIYKPTPEPPKQEEPKPKEPTPPPIPKYQEPERRKPVVFEPAKVNYSPPSQRFNSDNDELFELEKSNDLSDRLSKVPISNIKMAMGINERFLIINELFKGKSSAFDQVVEKLNGLKSMEEARSFLEQGTIKDFEWNSEQKMKKAKRFIKLAHRLYLNS